MHDPRESHMASLQCILSYLKGTLDHGISLYASPNTSVMDYFDVDWGGCLDTLHSTSGYCVFLGPNIVSWSSKRQTTVSHCSAEVEYRAIAHVVAETTWLHSLLSQLHCSTRQGTLVYCDNVNVVYLTGNPIQQHYTKHVEIDIHFVHDKVQLGHVCILHVASSQQFAYIFTKGLLAPMFKDSVSNLNVRSPPVSTVGEH